MLGYVFLIEQLYHILIYLMIMLQVSMFIVDLDVGFRQSPMLLIEDFMTDPTKDVLVQVKKDYTFCL